VLSDTFRYTSYINTVTMSYIFQSATSLRLALSNWLNEVATSTPLHLRTETHPVSETLCSFIILGDGQMRQLSNPFGIYFSSFW
jgi:hypothetical protein